MQTMPTITVKQAMVPIDVGPPCRSWCRGDYYTDHGSYIIGKQAMVPNPGQSGHDPGGDQD